MRRTAGRVGCGGGPARAGPLFSPPAGLLKPQVLREGEGDHRHQRMAVRPGPGAALEVAEAQEIERTIRIRVEVMSFEGVRRMVEAGLGIANLPHGVVTPYR